MKTPRIKSGDRPHRAGFTLVELLVVILIVGVIAAILIPVVGSVRETARKGTCMSNLRQLGVATQLYLADHANVMYPHNVNQGQYFWRDFLRPYIPKVSAMEGEGTRQRDALYCPDILKTRPNNDTQFRYTGYGKNANLGRTEGSPGMCKRITSVYSPSEVVLFWDDAQETNSDGGWPKSLSYWQGAWYQLAFRHHGKCHILFLDAHVASVEKGAQGDARDFPKFLWGPFPDYPDAPVPAQP